MATETTRTLIEKATIATDAMAAAGKLSPAQADRFIDYVVQETVLKDNARVFRFRNEEYEVNKIGVGRRLMIPKAEASAPKIRRGVTHTKITMRPATVMVPFEVTDEYLDINLEGPALEDRIVQMMAKQFGNDLEELFIDGDPLGPARLESDLVDKGSTTQYIKDSSLALVTGWLRRLDSGGHTFDAAGGNISASVFSEALNAMPTKFLRNPNDLRWFMSPRLWQKWVEKVSARATAGGDAALQGTAPGPFGIKPVPVPLFQFKPRVVQHITLNGTTPVALRYSPVTEIVVTPSTLDDTPVTAFVSGVDYAIVVAGGTTTIARIGGGAIADGQEVKVTYLANPQLFLTHYQNLIVGISRDIRIEKDRDIYKGVDQYAITAKVDCQIEETDASVKVFNIGTGA